MLVAASWGRCQTYNTGNIQGITVKYSKNVRNDSRGSWSLGYVRCTGRYDNISFNMKTTFCYREALFAFLTQDRIESTKLIC